MKREELAYSRGVLDAFEIVLSTCKGRHIAKKALGVSRRMLTELESESAWRNIQTQGFSQETIEEFEHL